MESPLFEFFQFELEKNYPSLFEKNGIQFKQSSMHQGYPEYEIVWSKVIPEDIQNLSQKICDFGKLFQIRILPVDIYNLT